MFAAFLLLAGCSKNDGGSSSNTTNQLKGMWSGPEFEVLAYMYATSLSRSCVYDFINNNTVISDGTVDKFQHDYETNKEPLPGHNGWYYLDVNKKNTDLCFRRQQSNYDQRCYLNLYGWTTLLGQFFNGVITLVMSFQ